MSKMCKLVPGCSNHKRMCVHEKIMTGVMAMLMIAGLAYWLV